MAAPKASSPPAPSAGRPGSEVVAIRLSDRYLLCATLAQGGMATVHLGRLVGPVAFARTVAIKRLLPHYASDPDFRLMLTDEARLAARVHHPNVVQMLDVVSTDDELFLVMEYVDGASLRRLTSQCADKRVPRPILAAIVAQLLHGLHAAHEATDEAGNPLSIVHRDVSPENVLVGADGLARILDFGVAKATSRLQSTRDGQIKGKLGYMAPEQLSGRATGQSDVFSASIVLWEGLVGKRLFRANDDGETIGKVLAGVVEPPSSLVPDVDPRLEAIVMRGLERDVSRRFATAREMALALEQDVPMATTTQVGAWVESIDGAALAERRALVRAAEAPPPPTRVADPASVPTRVSWATRSDLVVAEASSVPEPAVSTSRSKGRRVTFVAGAAVGLVAVFAWLTSGHLGGNPSRPPAAGSTSGAEAPPVPPSIEARAPPPPPPAVAAPTDAPTASTVRPSPRSTSLPRRPGAALAPAKAACNPPYRLGPLGEKVWLKECL